MHLPTVLVHGTFTIWISISVILLILTFLSDVTVIASAAFQAGVAAATSEEVKGSRYNVNSQGGDLFPLGCEPFGAWSPFALSTLCSIADCTTIKNGLPPKLAKCQLLQYLSVTLWH